MTKKCNAGLLLELANWQFDRKKLLAEGGSHRAVAELDSRKADVFVSYVGEPSALRECGLNIGHYDGTIATGTIGLTDVERVEQLAGVTRISLAARVHLHTDRSIPEIKADAIRSNAPPYVATIGPRAYTGRGVLLGVIDDMIVEFHRTFIKPNPDPSIQLTRIVGIWDQVRTPNPAKGQAHPAGFSYGTFYDEATINAAIKARDLAAIHLTATWDHGSHVTGIAAGNGAIKDNQFKPYTFVGVAPEADIAFCNAARGSASAVLARDALSFMFNLAKDRGQACVVNMSFGTHEGARDGSSDLEQAIDSALHDAGGEPIPGRAVVVAAGNEADMRRHSRKSMNASGNLKFRLAVSEIAFATGTKVSQDVMDDRLYVWYDGTATIQFRLTPPGVSADPAGWVNPGDPARIFTSGPGKIFSIKSIGSPDPRNGKNNIEVALFAPVKLGIWTIEMKETSGTAATVDIWVDRLGDDDIWPRFVETDNVIGNSVTCPCTAMSAIAVGAYTSEPGNLYGEHYGEICSFSSWGLDSVDGVSEDEIRPHIVAPGRRIIAANRSSYVDEKQSYFKLRFDGWTLSQHALFNGTSQAAPHVSGVIAMMFERNPTLTYKDVIAIFKTTASKAQIPIGLTFPNAIWGYGKLDASAVLAAVPAPGGGP
jgi:subtilisin family serine protease